MFLKSLFGRQALAPSLEAEGEYVGTPADDWGLGRVLVTMSPPSSSPQGTHRVVSWLMLVKEELLKELILLLLRSLEKTKKKEKVSSFRKKGLLPFPTLATAISQPGGQVALTTGRWELMEEAFGSQPATAPQLWSLNSLSVPRVPGLHFFILHPGATPAHHGNTPTKGIWVSTARCEGLSSFLSH